tara:strand:+ start:343 stop:516 length:174 start_codon:yes stop_codon:yes gene_type:complete
MDNSIILELDFFSKGIGIIYGTLLIFFLNLFFLIIEYFFGKKKKVSIKSLKKPFFYF